MEEALWVGIYVNGGTGAKNGDPLEMIQSVEASESAALLKDHCIAGVFAIMHRKSRDSTLLVKYGHRKKEKYGGGILSINTLCMETLDFACEQNTR